MNKNIICIISGPTASGKTKTSIELAKKFGGEIVNFDSLLFYKEIIIGTAKPTKNEQSGVIHHLIDTHSIKKPINAASYSQEAVQLINNLHHQNKIVYLVGGSGFYLQAVLKGMYNSPTTPLEVTRKSNSLFEKSGIQPFCDFLLKHDPLSFERYHKNDHYRIRRAVEHFWTNQYPFSSEREKMKEKESSFPKNLFNWNVFHAHLDLDRDSHFEIIKGRTKEMLKDGLIEEVKKLKEMGFTGEEKPLKSIGYKETFQYLDGKYKDIIDFEERINISTRQLAKSQRTWFSKVQKSTYNPLLDIDKLHKDFNFFLKE